MLTLTQAATLLGVTAATLRQQIANGRIKARKVGRDWTVTEREVERYRRESRRVVTYDMVQRKGASKRHVVKREQRVRQFPSRYEALTWCGVVIRGEYPTARGRRSDVSCRKCLKVYEVDEAKACVHDWMLEGTIGESWKYCRLCGERRPERERSDAVHEAGLDVLRAGRA